MRVPRMKISLQAINVTTSKSAVEAARMLPVVTSIHVHLGVVLARVTYKATGSGSTAIRRRRHQARARMSCRRVAAANAPVHAQRMEA